jgi:hypothetical protein
MKEYFACTILNLRALLGPAFTTTLVSAGTHDE